MLSVLKPVVERPLKPVARALAGVNPNVISLLGLVFPLLFFWFVMQRWYGLALAAFACNSLDMLDGMVARTNNKVSAFGGVLDSTIDRFADFVAIGALGFAGLVGWNVVMPLILVTYLISYLRSRTELAAKGQLVASVGLIERPERLLMLFAGLLGYALFPRFAISGQNLITLTCWIILFLSVITAAQRLQFAYRHLQKF